VNSGAEITNRKEKRKKGEEMELFLIREERRKGGGIKNDVQRSRLLELHNSTSAVGPGVRES